MFGSVFRGAGLAYLFEASVHDSYLVSGELGLFAQIFQGNGGLFKHAGRSYFEVAFLDGRVRRSRHVSLSFGQIRDTFSREFSHALS